MIIKKKSREASSFRNDLKQNAICPTDNRKNIKKYKKTLQFNKKML